MDALSGKKLLILGNKRDLKELSSGVLPKSLRKHKFLSCSSYYRNDIEQIEEAIFETVVGHLDINASSPRLSNSRHIAAMKNALAYTEQALETIDNKLGNELVCVDIEQALQALGEIIGDTTPDKMLDYIFANFCLGK